MKRAPEAICPGSARASGAGDRALAIANFSYCPHRRSQEDFGEGAGISTLGACAPRNFRFVCGTRSR